MNLNDLKNLKIDLGALRKFTLADIRNFINEQQVLAANIAIALGACLIIFFLMDARVKEYGSLNVKLVELQSKEDPVRAYEKKVKESEAVFAAIPTPFSEDDMVSYITQMAGRYKIDINEFEPPKVKSLAFYKETTVLLKCAVPKFQSALLFINAIEGAKHGLKINAWSARPKAPRMVPLGGQSFTRTDDALPELLVPEQSIEMTIEIASIELMDYAKRKPKNK